MRKNRITEGGAFWRAAAKSLPAAVQARYAGYFERAERWELMLDTAIEWLSRAKSWMAGKPAHA
jgi:hypothetical protein